MCMVISLLDDILLLLLQLLMSLCRIMKLNSASPQGYMKDTFYLLWKCVTLYYIYKELMLGSKALHF